MGQNFNKHFFDNTRWFSENRDSMFFKADTIKWIQNINPAPNWTTEKNAEKDYGYLNSWEHVQFELKHNNIMILIKKYGSSATVYASETWQWNYNKKRKVVEIYFKEKLIASFKPISQREIKIESKFSGSKPLTTHELTLTRVL